MIRWLFIPFGRMKLNTLHDAMGKAIAELKRWPSQTVQVFHHNDSDGLSSGAILTRALERQGYQVRRYCLEKPYPAVLRKVYEQEGGILVFADFAGRIAPLLSDLNRSRNLTLILDHHVAMPSTDRLVYNLDPDLYGLKGDRDISGSTTCYLFALELDPRNKDLASVAAIGAVGDGFFVDGRLVSENRKATLEAVDQGVIEIEPQENGELYLLKTSKGMQDIIAVGDYLDVLGGVGYYQNGPDVGVRVCLEGFSAESEQKFEEFQAIRTGIFDSEIARLKNGGMNQAPHIQWFNVEKRFFPMGVKMIGAFCDAIRVTDLIDPEKYLAGFQVIPDEIPGFGEIKFNETKVSMRVSPYMEGEIRASRAMGLNILLPEATATLGGFADACHSLTAAVTVAIGKEKQLIEEMEHILERTKHG
jgi:single-stranded-DNA-specific exonuclease